jgi:hypothetical protein
MSTSRNSLNRATFERYVKEAEGRKGENNENKRK